MGWKSSTNQTRRFPEARRLDAHAADVSTDETREKVRRSAALETHLKETGGPRGSVGRDGAEDTRKGHRGPLGPVGSGSTKKPAVRGRLRDNGGHVSRA